MKRLKKFFPFPIRSSLFSAFCFPLFICYFSTTVCFGKTTGIFQFLKIPVSTRLTSLGSVNAVSSADASVVSQNPSGAVFISGSEMKLTGVSYLDGAMNSVGVFSVFQGKNQSASGFYLTCYSSLHTKIDAPSSGYAYIEKEEFTIYNVAIGGLYSFMVASNTSFGMGVKFLSEKLYSAGYQGIAVDMSLTEIVDRTSLFCVGVKNLGFAFNSEYMPPASGYLSIIKKMDIVDFIIEGEQDIFNRGEVKIALEIPIQNNFVLRAGFHHPFGEYDTGDFVLSRITGGFGFKLQEINFDYAYYPKGELGSSHYITLGIRI